MTHEDRVTYENFFERHRDHTTLPECEPVAPGLATGVGAALAIVLSAGSLCWALLAAAT